MLRLLVTDMTSIPLVRSSTPPTPKSEGKSTISNIIFWSPREIWCCYWFVPISYSGVFRPWLDCLKCVYVICTTHVNLWSFWSKLQRIFARCENYCRINVSQCDAYILHLFSLYTYWIIMFRLNECRVV